MTKELSFKETFRIWLIGYKKAGYYINDYGEFVKC